MRPRLLYRAREVEQVLEHVSHHDAVKGAGREHREVVGGSLEEDQTVLQAEPPRVRARLGGVRIRLGVRLRVRVGGRVGVWVKG